VPHFALQLARRLFFSTGQISNLPSSTGASLSNMSDPPAKEPEKDIKVNGDEKKPDGEAEKPVEPVLTVKDGPFLHLLSLMNR
jgi:hypothetical protein